MFILSSAEHESKFYNLELRSALFAHTLLSINAVMITEVKVGVQIKLNEIHLANSQYAHILY